MNMNFTAFNILVAIALVLSVLAMIKSQWALLLGVSLILICVALLVGK